jgi:hypothetical protein
MEGNSFGWQKLRQQLQGIPVRAEYKQKEMFLVKGRNRYRRLVKWIGILR